MSHVDLFIAIGGGLGLFLLGMIIMTEGLRALAGDAIRKSLMRFTRTPVSGAITGAACTAVLQSSSATTVAAVGFVGAGLMSFPNALGIIFGANIGTTITGWLVAVIGFKLKLASLALPLVLAGALLRLFTHGRSADAGYAIAGFALIFIGIDTLQTGMAGLEAVVSFSSLPAGGLLANLRLVAIGVALAIVMQSSSATVAAALTAMATGLLDLPQALCVVIGADVGTTATAALATIGASTEARRTGLSHVIYNFMTGLMALLLVTPYLAAVTWWTPALLRDDPEFLLVGFHSAFNFLGLILVLPFSARFAALVTRLVAPRADELRFGLDPQLLSEPGLALRALRRVSEGVGAALLEVLDDELGERTDHRRAELPRLQGLLDEAQGYLSDIDPRGTRDGEWDSMRALILALDHLQRLHERLEEEPLRARTVRSEPTFAAARGALLETTRIVLDALASGRWSAASAAAPRTDADIDRLSLEYRAATTDALASRELSLAAATERLEAARWLHRVAQHVAGVSLHFEAAGRALAR